MARSPPNKARACLARIAAREADVRAWSYVDPDAVIRQARELDKLPSRWPLQGIPVGVKDIYNTAAMPTQHNSPIYIGHRPNADAATVGTLRAAGASITRHRILAALAAGVFGSHPVFGRGTA